MIIAIDFDGTWTRDPSLWMHFAREARTWGYKVIIATGRKEWSDDMFRYCPHEEVCDFLNVDDIVYCGNRFKEEVCAEVGYKVDVWIDDTPGTIQRSKFLEGDDL